MKMMLRIPTAGPIHPELSRWLVWFAREVPDADIGPFTNNIGIDRARNAICHRFLKSDCTHLWMLDHEVVPPRKVPWSAEKHACWSGIYDHLMGHQLCKSAWRKRNTRSFEPLRGTGSAAGCTSRRGFRTTGRPRAGRVWCPEW